MSHLSTSTRRALLKKMGALSLAPVATPLAMNLLGMANASAQTATSYKALVCVFLFGANDHYNTVIPYDQANYDAYYAIRKGTAIANTPYEGIALTRSALAATALTRTTGLASGLQMALGPTMGGLKSVFDAGRAGILLNVGPLVVPTSKSQFNNRSVPLPPKLFSHSDQQAYWQTAARTYGAGTEGALSGWGGRAADLILTNNSKASLSCVSINGNTLYLSGDQARSYQISTSGAQTVNALASNSLFSSRACADALRSLVTQSPSGHVMEQAQTEVMNRALNLYGDLNTALNATPNTSAPGNLFVSANAPTNNPLSQQLRMVARMLHQRNTLGLKRQVFMVGMGGFDLHDFLPTQHPGLLQRVSDALKEFNDALNNLGLANQVTTFTASDFGRTLASNGDGSDHGWGSHHFIMGGAVNGGRFFGKAPPLGVTHDEQVGSGRLLPSTSVDQMGAELARWFGVSNADMSTVLPNSANFDLHRLGLMKSA
ncbi:MAG: hypothetical protein RL297_1311 [Pseudomonadota bacterium]|jgi:uncharacterized protein (DUF1501 family)